MARGPKSKLELSFVVDSKGLQTGMRRVSAETGRLSRSTRSGARSTAALGSALRTAAIAAGGAAAAYLSITQAQQAITTTQELALATSGLNRNLGLATEEASRWAAVTRARGIDSKTLVMSFTSLSKAIDSTRTGTESSLRPFQALGITQKELGAASGDFRKQILLVADALGEAEGSSTRQAAASKLLGRGYRDLLPVFAEGSKGLQEQLRWADEFGATMGEGTVDSMMKFTTAQRRGRVALMGLQIAFAKFATPAITEAIESLGQFAAVLNDPTLTKARKLTALREQFQSLQDRVISVINALVPIVAETAGEIGVALARGIARGFQDAGILGKLTITAFMVSMFGGPRAIIAAGATVGALMSRGMASVVAARTAAMETFAMARSMPAGLSRGVAASSVAAAGAAAPMMARSIFASLARAIPMVAAAFAIGDVLLTAIAGDIKGAAIKGGGAAIGAAIGGVIGSFAGPGGTLAGAGIGAGLGALGANLVNAIAGGVDREMPTLQDRLAAATRRLADSAERERGAYRTLAQSGRFVADSRRRQKVATDAVRAAEANLAEARRRHGPQSEQAIAAERRLARAKNNVAAATKRAQLAERLHGEERRAQAIILRETVTNQKVEVRMLRRREASLRRQVIAAEADGASRERILELGRKYRRVATLADKAQGKLNRSYDEAGRKIGPKFELSLRRISARNEELRRIIPKVLRPLSQMSVQQREAARISAQNWDNFSATFGEVAGAFINRSRRVNSNAKAMPKVQKSATDRMIEDLNNKIGVIGDLGSPRLGRRRGGSIFGTGESILTAVSPGELVSYKGREMFVPGKPQAADSVLMHLPVGAKVFTHDGQRRLAMGASHAQALRDQAPHFQAGGIVKPTVSGGSPRMNTAANKGIRVIHARAQKKYENNMLTDLDSAVKLAARFGLSVSSGYRPGDDGFHGVNRARDFVGTAEQMYRFAKFIGTRFGNKLLELIYSPLGWSIDNYQRTAPYAVADHYDHVHVAMRKGGRITANSPLRKKKRWGPNQLHTLAAAVGMPNPGLMAQIAQGESGGRANLNNAGLNPDGSVDYGLWQINSIHGKPVSGMLNPIQNALYAREILRSQGLGAWVAYSNGRYAQFSRGQFDREFYYDLLYSDRAQRNAKRSAKKKVGRVRDMRAAARSRGATPAARKRIGLAAAAAKKALRLARVGNVDGSRSAGKAVNKFLRKTRSGLGTPRDDNKDNRPNKPRTIAGTVGDLLDLAATRKISRDTRESLLSSALSIAQGTEQTTDDLEVLRAQKRFQLGIEKTARARLNRATRKLRSGKLSKKDRRKWRRKRNDALDDLGASASEIASINTDIAEARGGGDAATSLADAMKELADAIKEQNQIQSSVQAVSSREALRLLSDVISGEIVGKRLATSSTPTGVRY